MRLKGPPDGVGQPPLLVPLDDRHIQTDRPVAQFVLLPKSQIQAGDVIVKMDRRVEPIVILDLPGLSVFHETVASSPGAAIISYPRPVPPGAGPRSFA